MALLMTTIKYKKTFWMNVVLTVLWTMIVYVCFRLSHFECEGMSPVVPTFFYCCLIATPLANTLSLKFSNYANLNLLAKIGNWCAIGLTLVYYVLVTYSQYQDVSSSFDITIYPQMFVVFMLPSLITLRALKRV